MHSLLSHGGRYLVETFDCEKGTHLGIFGILSLVWLNYVGIIPSDRALPTSYRLSIVTMFPSAVVWLQFSKENFKLNVARKW